MSPSQVVAQALGLALTIGFAVAVCVQVLGPKVLVHLAGEKSKEVTYNTLVIVVSSSKQYVAPVRNVTYFLAGTSRAVVALSCQRLGEGRGRTEWRHGMSSVVRMIHDI